MRGYLKSPGHKYILDDDITSIGKGINKEIIPPTKMRNAGSHIPLESGKAEPFHALVERQNDENCFILTDLNTAYGTYVNDHRIQNGAVKLEPGDVIRFGQGGIAHEFDITDNEKHRNSNQREQVTSTLKSPKLIPQNKVESGCFETVKRPFSSGSGLSSTMNNIVLRPDTAPTSPRHFPFSKLHEGERSKSVPLDFRLIGNNSKVDPTREERTDNTFSQKPQEGWNLDEQDMIDSCDRETVSSKISSWEKEQSNNEPWYVAMLREKEQRLLHMGDEISRLSVLEEECHRKGGVISELRDKVTQLEHAILEVKTTSNMTENQQKLSEMEDEINRLSVFERECGRKDRLVASLRDQTAKLEIDRQALMMEMQMLQSQVIQIPDNQLDANKDSEMEKLGGKLETLDASLLKAQGKMDEFRKQLHLPVPDRRDPEEIMTEQMIQLEEKDEIIEKLKHEIQQSKHEANLSLGLVQALQRDVCQGQHKVMKLTIALEKEQHQSQEAHAQLQAMSQKFANLKEERKHEEIVAVMETELINVNVQLESAHIKLSRQQDKLDKQSKEIRRAMRQNKQYFESGKLSQVQMEEMTSELNELRQKEQTSRVNNEQTQSRLERLRSRIVQAVYTAPGAVRPESRLHDAEILNSIQKIIDDRSEFHQLLSDLGQNVPALTVTLESSLEDNASGSEGQTNTPTERKSAKSTKKSGKK